MRKIYLILMSRYQYCRYGIFKIATFATPTMRSEQPINKLNSNLNSLNVVNSRYRHQDNKMFMYNGYFILKRIDKMEISKSYKRNEGRYYYFSI